LAAIVAAGATWIGASSALAFDTGPHFDITRDALTSEGFGEQAIQVTQVNNWFVDFYENAGSIPQSGHTGIFRRLLGGGLFSREHWADQVVKAADRSHFDQTDGGFSTTAAVTAEWDRLGRATRNLALEARDRNDPVALLTVLGASLHQVQDFYSHSNWVEPDGEPGRDGPGWTAKGWGTTPTWFDIPKPVRDAEQLYTAGSQGVLRDHGSWKADDNDSLHSSMAKDWAGRPLYTEAYTSAYFATRQWVQAVRAAVADDAFWGRAMALSNQPAQLASDQKGALNISMASGHWHGQGEACNPRILELDCGERSGPGGSLFDLRGAIKDFFDNHRSRYRTKWESMIRRLNDPNATGTPLAVPSSQPMQASVRFVRADIRRFAEIDNLDIPGGADMFLRMRIGGQPYISGVINDRDTFNFTGANKPFIFLKSVANGSSFDAPVESIRVRIRTANVRNAGTDDDVYLRINDAQRFLLDKRLYDDFERGDDDTYSVPIDDAIKAGLRIGDIRYLQIEKSTDGLAGGWRLGGASVWVNERLVVTDNSVNRWLEDGHRTWRFPTFVPESPRGTAVPAFAQLWEMDAPIRGDHDHTDTHPWDKRRDTTVSYTPGAAPLAMRSSGGSRFGGRRGDGDRASFDWALSTVTPRPSTVTPQPTPGAEPAPPDLRISGFGNGTFTIVNSGGAAAAPFMVSVVGVGSFSIPGLAAGASVNRTYGQQCTEGTHTATVDSAGQVAESNESNNVATFEQIC
jgi:hypothetical protein